MYIQTGVVYCVRLRPIINALFRHLFVVLLILQSLPVNLFMFYFNKMNASAMFNLIKYRTTMAYNNNRW